MALVTVQRSPSVSSSPPSSEYGGSIHSAEEEEQKIRSLSEYYFAVKGFAVLLPKNECQLGRVRRTAKAPPDIQLHLQSMLHLLCQGDTLHMAVRLESQHLGRVRYLAVVGRMGRQDTEEDCLLGMDLSVEKASMGLVVPVLADTMINLDGDGGFSVSTAGRKHIFKPVSVQAMWSALQTLHKSSSKAQDCHYFLGGLNHDWVGYYERGVASDQSCINEWNAMDSLESKRPPSPDSLTDKEETQLLIRSKLKEIMMSVDIDEVTSKYIRSRLEEDLAMDLYKFKSYIDQEMLVILGQMDAATEIFPHVYLGSEWNASNLEELQRNGVGFILNVTKEIDNFYPGTFDYLNIRVYDDEKTELLKHWDRTFRYIAQVKDKGSKVLVHCRMGISRSASVVIAYAMKAFNMSLDEALSLVKKKRNCIKPNKAFCVQLKTYEGILDASRQRHNILWRSKSETNLKSRSAHANRSTSNNIENNNLGSDDVVDSSNNNERHKSNEELTSYHTLAVPSPAPCRPDENQRPKSWSPDDHTAALLFSQEAQQGDIEYGESWRRSQSLNTQSWRAHVTLQQRDVRDIRILGSSCANTDGLSPEQQVVEAVNPLYIDATSGGTLDMSALQLSSSVKDRINEFENVQSLIQPAGKKPQSDKKDELVMRQNSSNESCHDLAGTAELDKVIETLLSPGPEDLQGSEPVMSQTKQAAQKHQAVLIPSQLWQEEHSELDDASQSIESPSSTVSKEEVLSWPTGIVKRQKQDFESKLNTGHKESDSLPRQGSSTSLSSLYQKAEIVRSPSYLRQDSSGSDSGKRDDPFSAKLDKVFDREEKKQQRISTINPCVGDTKDTPSRNSSWGSFDSAVVLMDRELPSRQSSWGSCDTRGTVGTAASRNSSFGPCDVKQPLQEGIETSLPLSNISGTYFEKDYSPFSPGTIKRNRLKNLESKECIASEECSDVVMDDNPIPKVASNVKAYGPAPYKSPIERVPSVEVGDDKMEVVSEGSEYSKNVFYLPISIPDSTNPSVFRNSQLLLNKSPTDDPDLSLASKVSDEEVPLPGTVKQHKQLLESLRDGGERPHIPAYNRSQSYSSFDLEKNDMIQASSLSRSFSEKRAKFEPPIGQIEGDSEEGLVKKMTRALEQQKYEEKLKKLQLKGIRKRSHSLERLSTSPTSPNCCPQQLLNEIWGQVQPESGVNQEQTPNEEICVRNLVGKFEDTQLRKTTVHNSRSVRAKSDGSTPDKFLPPVPQRKSSLDYNFKPNLRAQSQPPAAPVRKSPSSGVSPVIRAPIHKPPPKGRGQTCGGEVRQKKQQGKTHPLTKLTRNRESYHTM